MKKKIRLLLLFTLPALGWLLFPWGCKKEDTRDCPPDLPCATMTGENTFGCYIDGKPWVAGIEHNWTPGLRAIDALYDENGVGINDIYYLSLGAKRYNDTLHEGILLVVKPIYGVGIYSTEDIDVLSSYIYLDNQVGYSYEIDTLLPFELVITRIDTSKNICSGIFDFTATAKGDKKDTLHFKGGRFDVKYQPD